MRTMPKARDAVVGGERKLEVGEASDAQSWIVDMARTSPNGTKVPNPKRSPQESGVRDTHAAFTLLIPILG